MSCRVHALVTMLFHYALSNINALNVTHLYTTSFNMIHAKSFEHFNDANGSIFQNLKMANIGFQVMAPSLIETRRL